MNWKQVYVMSAIVNQDWRPMTLSELFVMYQSVLMETWHHTANLKGCFAGGKNTTYESLHPYMSSAKTKTGIVVVPQNAILSALEEEDDFLSEMIHGVDYPPETLDILS